ncbi:MAG: TniQ family protein [Burkholderiaceae bacterium]|nr:TniQ family protein [Burkholderiaceae bacterium]
MPEEPAAGQLGRMVFQNCMGSVSRLSRGIRAPYDPMTGEGQIWVEMLARLSNLSTSAYARRHTFLGVMQPTRCSYGIAACGSPQDISQSWQQGLALYRQWICVCAECVKDDLAKFRFSWFRRSHQLIGVDWCTTHGCALLMVEDCSPFLRPPHHWIKRGLASPVNPFVEQLEDAGTFVRRFIDVSTSFLRRSWPMSCELLNECLRKRARRIGICTEQCNRSRRLTAYVRKIAPKQWLQQHFSSSKRGHRFDHLVRLLDVTRPQFQPRGEIYALALTALFDDAALASAQLFSGR